MHSSLTLAITAHIDYLHFILTTSITTQVNTVRCIACTFHNPLHSSPLNPLLGDALFEKCKCYGN